AAVRVAAACGCRQTLPCVMRLREVMLFYFFFQAEDGIRDYKVTGVQTCALPICPLARPLCLRPGGDTAGARVGGEEFPASARGEIGRASCRERVESGVAAGSLKTQRVRIASRLSNERARARTPSPR